MKNKQIMKNLLTLIIVMMTVIMTNGEPRQYNRSSLKQMTKTTLTEIYLNQVSQLSVNLPCTPFTLFGKDTTNYESTSVNIKLDIPNSEYLETKRNNTITESIHYGDVVRKEFYEIIPYADKQDIINSILYLQKVNNDVKTQKKMSRLSLNKILY